MGDADGLFNACWKGKGGGVPVGIVLVLVGLGLWCAGCISAHGCRLQFVFGGVDIASCLAVAGSHHIGNIRCDHLTSAVVAVTLSKIRGSRFVFDHALGQ